LNSTQTDAALRCELGHLYHRGRFRAQAWRDSSDHAYLATHLVERSIALLASELVGELIDVGCGEQPYRDYFSHVSRKLACDIDKKRGDVDFACPASKIPIGDNSLDAILCTEVLEHVPDPLAVWHEFYRILRAGGKVLLTTPMYWPAHERPHDYFRYPEDGLRFLAERTGFSILRLMPRGGVWAFLGQIVLHIMPQYFPWRWQRHLWNRMFLFLDSWRLNPTVTLGWTILAQKGNS
jgi:SAM-dependent methyltransferase